MKRLLKTCLWLKRHDKCKCKLLKLGKNKKMNFLSLFICDNIIYMYNISRVLIWIVNANMIRLL
jgi:hypothetical protein